MEVARHGFPGGSEPLGNFFPRKGNKKGIPERFLGTLLSQHIEKKFYEPLLHILQRNLFNQTAKTFEPFSEKPCQGVRKLRTRLDQSDVIRARQKPNLAGRDRLGCGGAAPSRFARIAGTGFTGLQSLDDLFPSRRSRAVEFHTALLDNKDPLTGPPFAKEEFSFGERFFLQAGLYFLELAFREPFKKRDLFGCDRNFGSPPRKYSLYARVRRRPQLLTMIFRRRDEASPWRYGCVFLHREGFAEEWV